MGKHISVIVPCSPLGHQEKLLVCVSFYFHHFNIHLGAYVTLYICVGVHAQDKYMNLHIVVGCAQIISLMGHTPEMLKTTASVCLLMSNLCVLAP